ncbi:hypothetical protein V6N13_141195 [Hibiscus sabdariffa]
MICLSSVNRGIDTVEKHSVLNESEIPSSSDLVSEDTCNMTANSINGKPPDRKTNTQPGEDASELDTRNENGTSLTEVSEHDVQNINEDDDDDDGIPCGDESRLLENRG